VLILAIETSTSAGSVALLEGERSWFKQLSAETSSARSLAPVIRELLQNTGFAPQDLDAITVTVGPGSFTGLRVGVMTAKALGYTLGRPCVGVNALEVIATQIPPNYPGASARTWAILDAQRRQLFVAAFRRTTKSLETVVPTQIMNQADWLAGLQTADLVTGMGIAGIRKQLAPRSDVQIAEEGLWRPHAETVARLGRTLLESGAPSDPWRLAPQYYRLSAAEEKARNQLGAL
jgi:tRNA threonylcarbamoyladenosine biosynthesis protein TsaB